MLDPEKIKQMTRASLYAEKQQRKELRTGQYFRDDYVALHTVQTLIVVTVGFLAGVAMWMAYHWEEVLTQTTIHGLLGLAGKILLYYAIVLVAYLMISLIVYTLRYRIRRRHLREYAQTLKDLARSYEAPETAESGKEKEK